MDGETFGVWRAGIGLLSSAQRSLAFQDLALAEANDPVEFVDAAIEDVGQGGGDAAEAAAVAGVSWGCAPDLFSRVGQDRIRRFGCPHCGGDDVGRWGRANALPRYRCKGCRKTFSPLTGTPLAGLRYRERWMDQAEALISGKSVAKAAERCRIDPTTAFRWRHRFLSALNFDKPGSLSGIVEADETFVFEIVQGQAQRPSPTAAKAGRQSRQTGPVEGANPRYRRS